MRQFRNSKLDRTDLIRASAFLSAGAALSAKPTEQLGPSPYTVSINIGIMFPKTMPRAQRLEAVSAQGVKAFTFWSTDERNRTRCAQS